MHMKRIAAVSLGALLSAAAWGQHGGSLGHARGGFSSGHSFSAPTYSHPSGISPANRPDLLAPRSYPYSSPAPFGGTYPYGGNKNHYRYPGVYRPYYSRGVYLVPGWPGSGFYDSGYAPDYSDQPQPAASPEPYVQPQSAPGPTDQDYAQLPARPAYPGPAAPSSEAQEQPQVTLVFKDGRPEQVVQNYAVTRTTLYVLDGSRRREIPLADLNLSQTEKMNREAGVDFAVPAAE